MPGRVRAGRMGSFMGGGPADGLPPLLIKFYLPPILMEALVPYAIIAVLAISGLGLLAIVVFGLRNITFGKVSPVSLAIGGLPVVLLVILGFATGDWPWAAILTLLVAFGLAIVALLFSSISGLFT